MTISFFNETGVYNDYSDEERQLLSVTPHVTGALSILGSAYIMYDVASDRKKWSSPYYRLLFAMGVVDFLSSFATALSTVPMPTKSKVYHSSGTCNSCTVQGFFIHFNIASPLYNLMLSIYFLLTVTFKWSKDDIKKRVEIWLHVIPLVWSLTTAIVVLIEKGFSNSDLWCWIGIEKCGYCKKYRMYFFFGPLWIAWVGTMVIMGILVHSVRKTEKKAAKWRPDRVRSKVEKEASSRDSSLSASQKKHLSGDSSLSASQKNDLSRDTSLSASQKNDLFNFLESKETQALEISNSNASALSNSDRGSVLSSILELPSRFSSVSVDGTTKSAWTGSMTKCFDSEEKRARKKELRMTRIVTVQAFLYCLVFWITWLFGSINRVLQMERGHSYFGVMFFHAMFTPMQGFLNFIVYTSLRVRKWWKKKKAARPGANSTGNRSRRKQENEEESAPVAQENEEESAPVAQENEEESAPVAKRNCKIKFATSDHCGRIKFATSDNCIDIGEDDV